MSGKQEESGVRARKVMPKHVPMSLDGHTDNDLFIDLEMVIRFPKLKENNSTHTFHHSQLFYK